jgi:hypothetical protein
VRLVSLDPGARPAKTTWNCLTAFVAVVTVLTRRTTTTAKSVVLSALLVTQQLPA